MVEGVVPSRDQTPYSRVVGEAVAAPPPPPVPPLVSAALDFRGSPLRLFFQDLKLMLKLLVYLRLFLAPLKTENPRHELYPGSRNGWEIVLHTVLGVISGILMLLTVPMLVAAPVGVFVLYVVLCNSLMLLLCYPLNRGPRCLNSRVDGVRERPEEKWVFVNGVCAGKYWLRANVDMLSTIFGRPVVGIHNRSYGVVFDLLECVIQRCFSIVTKGTRCTYEHLRAELLNSAVTKVVVIAHSQGGIILSAALDMLLVDLPGDIFRKLEIYTFGCAANHFNNPLTLTRSGEGDTGSPCTRCIQHIEHYCNEFDFVALFGALSCIKGGPTDRFVGNTFMNKGRGGHLMNQHYLDVMFSEQDSPFLEQTVPEMETEAGSTTVPHTLVLGGGSEGAMGDAIRLENQRIRVRRVRSLSRLWKYRNGGSP